jgi:hypothetical protein
VEITAISKLGELSLPFYQDEEKIYKDKEKLIYTFSSLSFQDLGEIGLGNLRTEVNLVFTINLF